MLYLLTVLTLLLSYNILNLSRLTFIFEFFKGVFEFKVEL